VTTASTSNSELRLSGSRAAEDVFASVFASQSQAKRFVVERIAAEAAAENRPLSEDERRMLDFSDSDPEHPVDHELVDRFTAEISDEEYEAKVAGLFARADHYVLVTIDRALRLRAPARLRPTLTLALSLCEGEGWQPIPSPPEGERARVRGRP
jgi:hypothetical protein